MILRTLAVALFIALVAAVALAAMVLAFNVLRTAVQFIASDERMAAGFVVAAVIVGLVFVIEGSNRNGTR